MNQDEPLRERLNRWISARYPEVCIPDEQVPLGYRKLMNYYEHLEIAMLELRLLDRHADFLHMIRKRKAYLRRLGGGELQKEQFRAMTAF
jgi:hypothetical protein